MLNEDKRQSGDVTPLVSVIMLAYRHEKFIAQSIEGVIAQKCDFPFELIIGEDCSPDATREIVLGYQKRYPHLIRVLTGDINVGMHENSKRCFNASRGEFLAYCEGDDFWHHCKKLQMQVDLLTANPEMSFCHTNFDRMTRRKTTKNAHDGKTGRYIPAQGAAYEALLFTWSVMTATSMYRRSIVSDFMASQFYNQKWPFGDLNLLLYASLKGTLGYINISTATFRKMSGSAGNKGFRAALDMQLAAQECVFKFMDNFPVGANASKNIIASRKVSIYLPAYFDGRIYLMNECFDWLRSNGFNPSKTNHLLRVLSIRAFIPHYIHRKIQGFVTNTLSSIPS